MATYLLTWNPARWHWANLSEEVAAVRNGRAVAFRWSSGNTTRIEPGDRLFILKQGSGERGSFGVGRATSGVFEDAHYDDDRADAGDTALYVDGIWETLLNPETEQILPLEELEDRVPGMYWAPPASGTSIPVESAALVERLWADHLLRTRNGRPLFPDEVAEPERFFEGATLRVPVNVYERNPAARAACIAHYGAKCQVCDFDFGECYGEIGEGFIHVHHLKLLSEIGQEYEVNPIDDLRPVCPNCHAMLHQRSPPLTIEELKRRIRIRRS
jgi:5-methylcytosine-specific restriction protein A